MFSKSTSEAAPRLRLQDLYDEYELWDETEALFHHIDDEVLAFSFERKRLPAAEIENVLTTMGDVSLLEAYRVFATADQRALVADIASDFPADRTIILKAGCVIDGCHHLIAAHERQEDVFFIDLKDAEMDCTAEPAGF